MGPTNSINQSLDYIENHLTQPATIEQAAAAAGYSRHHFSRMFLAITGLNPTSYLRKRRLSEAARELVNSSKRILDIALDYQYTSQEAFTRSFRREFGVNPGYYRQRGQLCRLWDQISLGVSNLLYPGHGISPSPKLIVPEQTLVAAIISPRARFRPSINSAMQTISTNGLAITPDAVRPGAVTRIRPAHRQDIPTLCYLYQELHESKRNGMPQHCQTLGDYECIDASALSISLCKRLDTIDVAIWVAEVNEEVVGLVEVTLRQDEQKGGVVAHQYGYLQSLVVRRSMRGRGIGVKLLEAAEAWSKQKDATELRLDTWEFEREPLHFYEKQGLRTLRRTLVREL